MQNRGYRAVYAFGGGGEGAEDRVLREKWREEGKMRAEWMGRTAGIHNDLKYWK